MDNAGSPLPRSAICTCRGFVRDLSSPGALKADVLESELTTWAAVEHAIGSARRIVRLTTAEVAALSRGGQISADDALGLTQRRIELGQAMEALLAQAVGATAAQVSDVVELQRQVRSLRLEIEELLKA